MGLGPAAVQNTLELWQQGFFEKINSVIEIGSQEIHMGASDFRSLLEQACIPNWQSLDFPGSGAEDCSKHLGCSAEYLYRLLGVEKYDCIDINGELGAIKHDLNYPLEGQALTAKYDLVTDHGSCEHVFNVAQTYQSMHEVCKTGGLIVISQNTWGGNGYFLFDRSFYESLAAANNYTIVHDSYVLSLRPKNTDQRSQEFHIPPVRSLLNAIDRREISEMGVYVVLKKNNDQDFRFAYQGDYLAEREGHSGFNKLFDRDPPGLSYVPEYAERRPSHIPSSVLAKELLRRIVRKVTGK